MALLENKAEQRSNATVRLLSVSWFSWGIIVLALALAGVSVYYTLARHTVGKT